MPSSPKISVITVVKNGVEHIERSILSVLPQLKDTVEYIVIDGGSTDGTLGVLTKYKANFNVLISEPDSGIYNAMNKGIALANGELIGILNSDDQYFPNSLEWILAEHRTFGANIYHANVELIKSNGNPIVLTPELNKLPQQASINHTSCFVQKSVYDRLGNFDETYQISSDYEFLLRCFIAKEKFHYINRTITRFYSGGASGSCYSNIEGYKILKKHNTGHQYKMIYRGVKCYLKKFVKSIIL
jgi:glycosyltransferase involved in cell wall biosynthesis